jgi:hypothetical protein
MPVLPEELAVAVITHSRRIGAMIDRFLGAASGVGPWRRCAVVALLLMVLFLVGCPRHIAPYRPEAYEKATSLKVDALNLMDKATEPYAQHQAAADTLRSNLDKAYEDAKGIPQNEVATQLWAILKDPNRNLLGGFLAKWQKESVLKKPFIDEIKVQVGDAFDKIIALESGKSKS